MNGNGYATKPTIITSNKFTQAATDNSDYMQENSSQYIINSVLYQYDVEGRFEYNIRSGNVVKRDHSKRRSFDVPAEDILHILATSKPKIPVL